MKRHTYPNTLFLPGVFKLLNEETHTLGWMFLLLGCEGFWFGWRDWERARRRWRDLLLSLVLPQSLKMSGLRGHLEEEEEKKKSDKSLQRDDGPLQFTQHMTM